MNIVHLAAGAGPMYCGSCLQGATLAAALREIGGQVLLAPLYTPLRSDEENIAEQRVAFGGINVHLQQHWGLFRYTPWWLDRLLDRPALLRWASRRGAGTRPEETAALAVSMLRGEEGRQRKELEKLLRWLDEEIHPDVVHLSTVLLCGLVRQLRRRLGVPVVATLAGEDAFLEKLPQPYYDAARSELRTRAAELDALVAPSAAYADFMAGYLALPRERIRVIPPGLNLRGHGRRQSILPANRPPTVGFLSRICPEKGLHQLLDAWALLAEDAELPAIRVRAAGYLAPADRPYLAGLQEDLASCGLAEQFEYVGELDRGGKIAFLQSLDFFSVPSVARESKALAVLEAWANGVPAVLPAHGVFPELVADTGGGLLFEPGDPAALATALKQLIQQPELAAACGRRAQEAVHQRYHARRMAQDTMNLYNQLLHDSPRSRPPFGRCPERGQG
jgi:glycosyltransferase involved in cell wall biosynthesis